MSDTDDREEERLYLEKIQSVLTGAGSIRASNGPSLLLDHLYIGSAADATDRRLLRRLHITHVLNCAAGEREEGMGSNPYGTETGVRAYSEFAAFDNDGYPIMMHFHAARAFIDTAAETGGCALVHCHLGVNRSGAICVAYVMLHDRITLLQAIRRVRLARPVLLCNRHFRAELFRYAKERRLLHKHEFTGNDPKG